MWCKVNSEGHLLTMETILKRNTHVHTLTKNTHTLKLTVCAEHVVITANQGAAVAPNLSGF